MLTFVYFAWVQVAAPAQTGNEQCVFDRMFNIQLRKCWVLWQKSNLTRDDFENCRIVSLFGSVCCWCAVTTDYGADWLDGWHRGVQTKALIGWTERSTGHISSKAVVFITSFNYNKLHCKKAKLSYVQNVWRNSPPPACALRHAPSFSVCQSPSVLIRLIILMHVC